MISVGRRHQFNLAKGIKSINRGNTDIAKSPWRSAVLGTRVLTLKHQKLPNPEQHTIPDLMGSSSQAMPAALEGREPKWLQSMTGCPKAPPHILQRCGRSCSVHSKPRHCSGLPQPHTLHMAYSPRPCEGLCLVQTIKKGGTK